LFRAVRVFQVFMGEYAGEPDAALFVDETGTRVACTVMESLHGTAMATPALSE
jgi:hypothetical protein